MVKTLLYTVLDIIDYQSVTVNIMRFFNGISCETFHIDP